MSSSTADNYRDIFIRAVGIVGLGLMSGGWLPQTALAQDEPAGAIGRAAAEKMRLLEDRRTALEMSYEHRDLEALPLLEALAKKNPGDREVHERIAVALVTRSATVDPNLGAALRRRAREILLELKKSGPISDLSEILAEGIPENGGAVTFSTKSDADQAMKEGEAAFSRRDFSAARRAYQRALTVDPRMYSAALFVGDTYFAEGRYEQASTWFNRAVIIDPNQETAHRYLGDAQAKAGHADTARLSYLDAVIATPYSRRPWMSLSKWAKDNQVTLAHPQIVPDELTAGQNSQEGAGVVKPQAADKQSHDGRSHWHLYQETRAAWAASRFKATFPKEKAYRHSLAEEAEALRQVAGAIATDLKSGRIKQPDLSFANLIKLVDEGLLEAHVLYARANDGISQDYEAYRATHRGELLRYLKQYVAPVKAADTPAAKKA